VNLSGNKKLAPKEMTFLFVFLTTSSSPSDKPELNLEFYVVVPDEKQKEVFEQTSNSGPVFSHFLICKKYHLVPIAVNDTIFSFTSYIRGIPTKRPTSKGPASKVRDTKGPGY
jgi:hypothetical protein